MTHALLWLFLMLPALTPAMAEEPELLETQIRFFPMNRQAIPDLFYQESPGVFTPVSMRGRVRSQPHAYKGPAAFSLYKREPIPETEEFFYTPLFTTGLPESAEDILLFLLPPGYAGNPDVNSPWIVMAMDDSEKGFPAGTLIVLNATGVKLGGTVGEKVISLGFDTSAPIPFREINSNRRPGPVDILFALELGEELEMVYANRLQFNPSFRSILVFRPPRRPRSIQIDSYLIEDNPADRNPETSPEEADS